jgi:hypothetical protein
MVVSLKILVIWHVIPCHLASNFQHFEGQYCIHQGLSSQRKIDVLQARVYYVGMNGEGSKWP